MNWKLKINLRRNKTKVTKTHDVQLLLGVLTIAQVTEEIYKVTSAQPINDASN